MENQNTLQNDKQEGASIESGWKTIFNSFSLFFGFNPLRISVLFFVSLLKGLTQGIGLVLIVPLLGATSQFQGVGDSNKWVEFVQGIFGNSGEGISLNYVLFFYGLLYVWVLALTYWESILQSSYQQGFSFEIRTRLFRKLITSNWSFLNKKSKHLHLQVLTTEVPKMTMFYYYFLSLAIDLIFIVTHLVLAFLISPLFTLLIIVFSALVFFSLSRFLSKSVALGAGSIMAFRNMSRHIDDFWLTIKGAKVHRSEQFYFKKYQESNLKSLVFQNQQVKNRALPQFLFSLVGMLFLILVIWVSVNYLSIAISTLVLLILLFSRVFPKIKGLNSSLNNMLTNLESVRIVLNLDKELADSKFEETQALHKPLVKGINLENISFGYTPDKTLYHNFSAAIPAHSFTGVFGDSGKGKTTLIDLIVGLVEPQKGKVTWDDEGVNIEAGEADHRKISYIPQDAFFVNGSLRENLIWDAPDKVTDAEIMAAAKMMRADAIIARLPKGLNEHIVNYSFQFSGGERQRLALVRALLRKPDVLILDESTSAIDYNLEKIIIEEIKQLAAKTTIVFITHRHHLQPFFNQVINLNNN